MQTAKEPQADLSGNDAAVDSEVMPLEVEKGTGGFVGNVLALSCGAGIAQALSVLSAPIISRLFMPDAFGLAAVFGSIVGITGQFGCLRYEIAMMLPRRDTNAAKLFGLCCVVLVTVVILVTLVIGTFGASLLDLVKAPELIPYRWLIPVGVFLVIATLPLRYWHTRHRQFKRLAAVRIETSVVSTFGVVGSGLLGFTAGIHLILARTLAQVVGPLVLGWHFARNDAAFVRRHCTCRGMWASAKRYKKFPLINSWAPVLNTSAELLPAILLAGYFDAATAGLYAFSRSIVAMPSSLISSATSQVFFQQAAMLRAGKKDLSRPSEAILKRLMSLGLWPMLVLAMAGQDLFRVLFGERWVDAGLYSSILTPWIFTMFVGAPLVVLFNVLERQGLALIFYVTLLVFKVGTLVFGGLVLRNVVWTLSMYSGVGALLNLVRLVFLIRLAKLQYQSILAPFLRYCLYVVPSAGMIACTKWWLGLSDVYILLAVALSAVPYSVLVLRDDDELRGLLARLANRVLRRDS